MERLTGDLLAGIAKDDQNRWTALPLLVLT